LGSAHTVHAQSQASGEALATPFVSDHAQLLKGLRHFSLILLIDGALLPEFDAVQTKTELRLRQSGITLGTGGRALLLECTTTNIAARLDRLLCEAQVWDEVRRDSPSPIRFSIAIWTGTQSYIGKIDRDVYERTLSAVLDKLLNDWYKANQSS